MSVNETIHKQEEIIGKKKWIKRSTTIRFPEDWWMKIDNYLAKHGYTSFPELIRDMLRKIVIEESKNQS